MQASTVSKWIARAAASEMLGVRPQTLYAYVSRGLIRSKADEDDPRRSLYSIHDIRALITRKQHARRRRDIAAGTIAWGEPLLETAISTIRDDRLIFRGHEAVSLSRHASLEEVARLLWQSVPLPISKPRGASGLRFSMPKARGFEYLSQRASLDPPSFGRSQTLLQDDAWQILSGFADALLGITTPGLIHHRIATVWSLDRKAADLVRRAVVLASDHELNTSTFAVRIAASTGAPLAAAALAGYSTLSGPLHGQALAHVLDFLDRACAADDPRLFIRKLLARGERIYAFGHPLYPAGDVRAAELLRSLKPSKQISAAIRAGERETGKSPIFDMALAALVRQLGLRSRRGLRSLQLAAWRDGSVTHSNNARRDALSVPGRGTSVLNFRLSAIV